VGDGPARPALERLAAELGILEQLHWEGVLSRGAVRRTMEQADLLAVPSRVPPDGDRDGIPNVVVEAMALGLPVVASCAGGLPEVVTPETGRPCPETSPEALARVILEARADPDENARRARQARCLVEREFDACRNSDLRAELFRQLLSQQES
jgi:glycosyltransferase involved in cell wall biosynthesis